MSFEIAISVSVELALEHLRVRHVSDAEKQRVGREIPDLAGLHIAEFEPGDLLVIDVVDIFHDGVEQKVNFLDVCCARSSMIFEARKLRGDE